MVWTLSNSSVSPRMARDGEYIERKMAPQSLSMVAERTHENVMWLDNRKLLPVVNFAEIFHNIQVR